MISISQLRTPGIICTVAIVGFVSPFFADQGSAQEEVPWVRFACQNWDLVDKQYRDYVLLADQLSTDSPGERDLFSPDHMTDT